MKSCIMTIGMALLLPFAVLGAELPPGQQIMRNGTYTTVPLDTSHFTGTAYMESLFSPKKEFKTYGASVTFAPGARTYWHIHPTGQVLLVTQGIGYTQEWGKPVQTIYPGDVIWCPPGVKHWHGATETHSMTHLAISEKGSKPVTWLEEVKTIY